MSYPQHAIYPSLRGKNVIITGGAEGIGAATATQFSLQGSRVAILDISESSARKLIEEISTLKPWHPDFPISIPVFYCCDVSDLPQLKAQANQVLQDFHGTVDILINNAGAAGASTRVPTEGVTPESWDADVAVNLRHMFFLTQAIVPGMRARKSGSIVNLGSISWRIPATGLPVYTTCKAGVMGLTRTHAREFGGDGVRVNSVMPGSIATERERSKILTPEYEAEVFAAQALKRNLLPIEAANLVVYLSSDQASGITGGSHVVDGGWTADP